jgi:DME family drug/metabolite transporter
LSRASTLPVGRGILFVALAATAWGTGGAAAAVLYGAGLGPVAVSWWRFVTGALLLAGARRFAGPPTRPDRRSWPIVLVTGMGLAVYQTAFYVALDRTGLAVATVVTLGAGPVLIALGGHFTGLERLTRGAGGAIAVALAGLLLLVGTSGGGHTSIAGIGFALLSAAGYAAVTLLARRGGGSVERYDAALGGFVVGAVLLTPLAAATTPTHARLDGTDVLLLGYLAIVPTALAYALFFAGLAAVRATTASVVALLEPVTATLVAVALLDERVTPTTAAGAVLLLAAVALLARAERRPTGTPARAAHTRAEHRRRGRRRGAPVSRPCSPGGFRWRRGGWPRTGGSATARLLGEALRAQRVDAAPGVRPHVDEPDVAQHAQMARDRWLRQRRERGEEVAGRQSAAGEQVKDGPAGGLGDGGEDVHADT